MNLLTDKLPNNLIINNINVPINTDFRIGIQFENLLKDKKLSDEEIWTKALNLYFGFIPKQEFVNEAIEKMLWFYRCGKETEQEKTSKKTSQEIYSFEYDADKIYSAFISQYKIDLQDMEYLHWWKFKSMFLSLKEDNDIKKIMNIRATDITNLSKEQKEYYTKMKKLCAIPRDKDEVEYNKNLSELLKAGKSLDKLEE